MRTLYTPDTTLSRRGLIGRADRRARELESLGIRAQDVVAVSLGNVAELMIVIIALSKLRAIPLLIDPANGDRQLHGALERHCVRAVIRRPRGMENAPLQYPDCYKLKSLRRLSGTLISVDILELSGPHGQKLPEHAELVLAAAAPDGTVRDIVRSAAELRAIGSAAVSALELDSSARLLCSESLSVPRFFDPVVLGWMASDSALIMAEDPSLKEALSLTREGDAIVAVDSIRNFIEYARTLRVAGSKRTLKAVIPQALAPIDSGRALQEVFGQVPRQLLQLEELGVLGARLMRRGQSFSVAAGVELRAGAVHRLGHRILVRSGQRGMIFPEPPAPEPGAHLEGGWCESGYVGIFRNATLESVVGRNDDLVNLEGRRVCLAAIEHAMLAHRRITWARPIVRHDDDGDSILSLEYVATGETELEDIEEHAVGALPPYMVPRRFLRLNEIPDSAAT